MILNQCSIDNDIASVRKCVLRCCDFGLAPDDPGSHKRRPTPLSPIQRDLGILSGSGYPAASSSPKQKTNAEVTEIEPRPDLAWDNEASGLCVRLYGDGTQSFIFVYRIDDREQWVGQVCSSRAMRRGGLRRTSPSCRSYCGSHRHLKPVNTTKRTENGNGTRSIIRLRG